MILRFLPIFTLFAVFLPYGLYAAEAPRPKAPPPVLLQAVPTVPEDVSTKNYQLYGTPYVVYINKDKNFIKIVNVSDPANPVVISENQYQTTTQEEKE